MTKKIVLGAIGLALVSLLLIAGYFALDNKKNKAGLQVLTNDIPSAVYLDNQFLDNSPFIAKELQPGIYNLRIEPENKNLSPHETSINLRRDLLTVVTWNPGESPEKSSGVIYELEKLPSKETEVSVISVPDNTIVSLDDQEKEFAPFTFKNVSEGSHEILASLPSYESQKHTINAQKGYRLNIFIKMARAENDQPLTKAVEEVPLATISAELATKQTLSPPKVIIKPTNFFQSGKEVLRVRSKPTGYSEELGQAQVGSEYKFLGETTAGWHKIDFDSSEGWVSAQYATLIEE